MAIELRVGVSNVGKLPESSIPMMLRSSGTRTPLARQARSSPNAPQSLTTTTAVGAKGAEETAVRQVRELENDDLFNQATVQKRGTVIAPDMSLSGEIVQQSNRVGRVEESYFFFHVVMTDLATGLAVWEDNVEIGKQETKSIFD